MISKGDKVTVRAWWTQHSPVECEIVEIYPYWQTRSFASGYMVKTEDGDEHSVSDFEIYSLNE